MALPKPETRISGTRSVTSGVPGNDSDHVKIDDRIDYLQNCGNDGLLLRYMHKVYFYAKFMEDHAAVIFLKKLYHANKPFISLLSKSIIFFQYYT